MAYAKIVRDFTKACGPSGVQYNKIARIVEQERIGSWQRLARECFSPDQKTGAFVWAMARIERSIQDRKW